MSNHSISEHRKQVYKELLAIGYGCIAIVSVHSWDFWELEYEQPCDVIHHNAPKPQLRCEIYDEKD